MKMIGKIVAALILGTLGYIIFGMIAGMASGATAKPNSTWVFGSIAVAIVIAFSASSVKSAWARLFFANGIGSLLLPLALLAGAPAMIARSAYMAGGSGAATAGATIGATVAGGVTIVVAIFLAAIFMAFAFALRDKGAKAG
ncbi:MAG TPA: hypothetical protein VG651_20390 [Stellaceae bacterium]|nr:hypothetical protein [Stellaceae bacterium]